MGPGQGPKRVSPFSVLSSVMSFPALQPNHTTTTTTTHQTLLQLHGWWVPGGPHPLRELQGAGGGEVQATGEFMAVGPLLGPFGSINCLK